MDIPTPRELFYSQNFIYGLIVVFFIFYLLSGFWLFGLLIGIAIIWAVALEFVLGTKKHGVKNELKETAVALLVALGIWFGSGLLLQTSSPLNAIVSCSMLPHVQRGDMVVLRGDRIEAPTAQVESLAGIEKADIYYEGGLLSSVRGSLYSFCAQNPAAEICSKFVSEPAKFTEKKGPLSFGYGKCERADAKSGSVTGYDLCVQWLEVNGKKYYENLSNDVVVYQPNSDEYYARVGDIIHRAYIKLEEKGGKTYFLTKGDNNPVFDIQVFDEAAMVGNRPVEVGRSKGRILLGIPYLGYFKLFISPSAIATPDGCDRVYAKYLN